MFNVHLYFVIASDVQVALPARTLRHDDQGRSNTPSSTVQGRKALGPPPPIKAKDWEALNKYKANNPKSTVIT